MLTTTEFCVDCLKIRVGRPLYVRGPEGGGLDGPISVEKLANGQFRGFGGANLPFPAYSYHVDALDPGASLGRRRFHFKQVMDQMIAMIIAESGSRILKRSITIGLG